MAAVEDVTRILRAHPGIPAAELAARLKVSPSRLSRLVAEAGEPIVRLGKARATRYALSRTIGDVGTAAPIFEIGANGAPREAGRLEFLEVDAYAVTHGGDETLHGRLPVFLKECGPSGFLGRHFALRFSELGLPQRLDRWRDDDYVRAIALRGEDAVGNLVVGSESLARFLRLEERPTEVREYPERAQGIPAKPRHSSAGGERPKFTALVDGRHVLVKFAVPGDSDEAHRWRDLLWCEHVALEVVREAGVARAVESRCLDLGGWRFLEVVRFDRVGQRGRVGVRSLEAVRTESEIPGGRWTEIVDRLGGGLRPRVNAADASTIRWLDAFGGLTGNDDRHDGNLSFLRDEKGVLSLAPAYDMVPMALAPVAPGVLDSGWTPERPLATALSQWKSAVPHAMRYWDIIAHERRLDLMLRHRARDARASVERVSSILFPDLRTGRGKAR